MLMIIDLKSVLLAPRRFEFSLEPGWWQGAQKNDQIIGLDGPLKVEINIAKAGSKYVLDGHLSGRLVIRCDRCLEQYGSDLDSDFSLFLAINPSSKGQNELELLEDDMEIDFLSGNEIDLEEVVRSQIYLSLPIKCLCSEDCLGLCPICGVNLNIETCGCQKEKGHPAFLKMKNLKFKGETK
jgi:uncharacterized protein